MIGWFFHRWERRLADVSRGERVVRPFEWGLDWLPPGAGAGGGDPAARIGHWVDGVMRDTDAFFTPPPTADYELAAPGAGGDGRLLTFPSALETPHAANNTVFARYFPADPHPRLARPAGPRRAIVVLPQWNADAEGHVGLARLVSKLGISAVRLTLPYHDRRMPPELSRADYIVSSNVVRTLQVCRQAVLDVRRALWWLRDQGYERLGVLGTSLGSCLAMLAAQHEPLVRAQALNHVSPHFADVVWRGVSTEHVRVGLDGHVDLETLRRMWRPISPWSYMDRVGDRRTLLVYAKYDLTFPVDLSRDLVREFRRRGLAPVVRVLPCGHYSTGEAPFKYLDAFYLGRFLTKNL
ncbi:MAG: RcgR family putative quorum lactone hydrolase [Vicinamibacterales bacterium]